MTNRLFSSSCTLGRRLAQLIVGAALLSGALPVSAQEPAIGLHYGSDFSTSQYKNFGTWLGDDVMYRVVFVDRSNWSALASAAVLQTSRNWVNSKSGRVEVISLPMFANGHTGGFASITNGSRDSIFRGIAAKIQSLGITKKVIIRLAWEGNGKWYLWSYQKDPAGFKAAWRRIVSVMRSAAPGLRFEFNISNLAERGTTGAKWTAGYPGDDVVDVISMDIYDHWHTWNAMVYGDAGLKEMRDFAIARNKPEAYAEWAVVTTSHGHGDNPTFIRAMASWMAGRPGKVLYQSYWNTTGGAVLYSSKGAAAPKAASAYKEVFRRKAQAAPPTSSSSAPTISSISDRTIDVNGSTGPISFSIGDAQTPASDLKLICDSSDPSVIPDSRIVFGGSGSKRTVTISPAVNKTGWSTIWLKVSDGKLSKVISFVVNVSPKLSFAKVGTPDVPGSHSYSGSKLTVRAGGYDIYNRADEFHFGSKWISGDAEITVKVSSLSNTHEWTKAGLMFRGSGASHSAFVGAYVTPANGVVMQWRTADGAYASSSSPLSGRAPHWLRLVRDGNAFFAFHSEDGVDWDLIDSTRVTLPSSALAGVALVSHAPGTAATAVFENFAVD